MILNYRVTALLRITRVLHSITGLQRITEK